MKSLLVWALLALVSVLAPGAQEFIFEAFVGTWEGTITSENYGYSDPVTLVVESDGFYTDSSGYLMPPYYYPDTQQCEFDAETNRVHFWYLKTVYAGMHFYQHHYYEVAAYTGDYLELHYNYWDDAEAHPEVQTISLARVGASDLAPRDPVAQGVDLRLGPSPFHSSLDIRYRLAQPSFVQLSLHDVTGRTVAELGGGFRAAGEHATAWRPADVPSGYYLLMLRSEAGVVTEKCLLMR